MVRKALFVALWAVVLGGPTASAQPDPPIVTDPAWFAWYDALLAQRLAECPRERSTTYYFSQSGDDVTGNGTMASPWKSLAKAKQVLVAAAPAGDVAVLFKRGDVWRETVGLVISTPRITIADYGTGEKPLLTVFASVGDPSLWTPTPGRTNVYQRPAPVKVTWAKQDDDLDRPWSRQRTVAGVEATPGSWCWLKGVLYVHPRHDGSGAATDPRVDGNAYEVIAIPDQLATPGIRVSGDGTRVENIRAQGWGVTSQLGTQLHPLESSVSGTDRVVFVGCEAHYGLSHVVTHASMSGGIATFVDCRAGLTTFSANGGETIFNTFSYYGGNQTIFDSCEATHGTLPSDDFDPQRRNGWAFYGHTGGNAAWRLGLTIAHDCKVRETKWGCKSSGGFGNAPEATQLQDVRCFVVGEDFSGGGLGSGEDWYLGLRNTARVNGTYRLKPAYIGYETLVFESAGWMINCSVELDCTNQPWVFSFFRSQAAYPVNLHIWNSYIGVKTNPGQTFRFDWSSPSVAQYIDVRNSVIEHSGAGTCSINPPASAVMRSNAYYGLPGGEVASDPFAVVLGAPLGPPQGMSCASPLACAATPLPGNAVLGFDRTGRAGVRNDIGPVEAFVCADCDGSGGPSPLTPNDFTCFINRYASGDAAANCDGSTSAPILTANDFQCFINAFAANCP